MKKILSVLLIAFIFVISAAPANADSMSSPEPYEIEFEEQDLVFRMVPDEKFESNLSVSEKSGLYVKSTGEKIYTVHEYFYESDLYFSADRLSFAAMTWQETNEDSGIIFHVQSENAGSHELIMISYPVSDLMTDLSKKEHSVSHYFWERWEKRVYDEENSTLSILTNDEIRYTFDIKTGKIIKIDDSIRVNNESKATSLRWAVTSVIIILTGGALALLYFVMKKYD